MRALELVRFFILNFLFFIASFEFIWAARHLPLLLHHCCNLFQLFQVYRKREKLAAHGCCRREEFYNSDLLYRFLLILAYAHYGLRMHFLISAYTYYSH